MIRHIAIPMMLASLLVAGCARRDPVTQGTLAQLRDVRPDVEDAEVEQGVERAMESYRRFLEETPAETAMTPEAMRRLADLQVETQFGIRGGNPAPGRDRAPTPAPSEAALLADTSAPAGVGGGQPLETPTRVGIPDASIGDASTPLTPFTGTRTRESDEEFEERTTAAAMLPQGAGAGAPLVGVVDSTGPLEAIAIYDRLLTEYPSYENSDQVLYQKARAYDELGRTDEAMQAMDILIRTNPQSEHYDEVQFRRGEYFFTRRGYGDAETAYSAIVDRGEGSAYHELALYKLGWTFYKQELYEDALHKYMALLDYKVSTGYDFDQTHAVEDERRVTDTYRAISLSFSYLGGPTTVSEYFSEFGHRSYEDRVYGNLGEHYLGKLRYDDAAKTYRQFETLYPFHSSSPHFGMRVVEIFTEGGFPLLVLEAKRDFASKYGLAADYWQHFDAEETPEVLAYLKSNLNDLATHYHAEYQNTEDEDEKLANYGEARRWYGDYLASFPADDDSPSINYRLAELLLEHGDFGEAARQYERTAYDYAPHPQAAAAGYAAVYAYRKQLEIAGEERQELVKRSAVTSSLRFADTFPDDEQAPAVLGAAADDLYELGDYEWAVESAQRVIDSYPGSEMGIRRSAWTVVAHGSFDLSEYDAAERAYAEVLTLTPEDDESRAALVDNLAASIYKQGELANAEQDYRAAADHFLRIRTAAPTSAIRPSAEYDAGVALMALEDWSMAANVLDAFRTAYPEHELQRDATRQVAYAYREDGQLSRAADEYDRVASESEDPELRSEALLVAGDLYEQSELPGRALDVYSRYVDEFPQPVEMNVETRVKISEIHQAANDESAYLLELERIVRIDAEAGPERTARTRTLAGRSALTLAERVYDDFVAVKLLQPFETSLEEKQRRMDETVDAMSHLVDYEIADVTAAATYYMAEAYFDFSRSLAESERPTDLQPAEMDQYEMGLDAAAFPFEERAIDVHEENMELLHAGVFNEWTRKSLGRLSVLMPGRYAKAETSSGILSVADSHRYESPFSAVAPTADAPDAAPGGVPSQTTNTAPTAPDDEEVQEYASPQ